MCPDRVSSAHLPPKPEYLLDSGSLLSNKQTETRQSCLGSLAVRRICSQSVSRQTLVFLHGWGGNMFFWERQFGCLPYRTFVLDLPGHGASSLIDVSKLSFHALIDAVCGFCEVLDLSDIVLVGHSYGGLVAALSANALQERLRAIVIVDQPLYPLTDRSIIEKNAQDRRADTDDSRVRDVMINFLRSRFSVQEQERIIQAILSVPRNVRNRYAEIKDNRAFDGFREIARFSRPLYSITSTLSRPWFGDAYDDYLAGICSRSCSFEIIDASHFLMLDSALEFNQRLSQVLLEV